MSVDLPTPDAALVTRMVAGDESALKALYIQSYDALCGAAATALGQDLAHYRGRVAEKAMQSAWRARDRFQNPIAVAAYLGEAVQAEVDVQKRKHAALHRREGAAQAAAHVTVPTAEESAESLIASLHAHVDHDKARAEAHEAKKAHAREHVQRVGGRPKWVVPTIIGAVAVVGIIALQRYVEVAGADAAVDRALKGENVQTLSAAKGQRGSLALRDSTKVRIGSDTRLRIPEPFATTQRAIGLDGTATFTVAPTTGPEALLFSVRTGDYAVTGAAGGAVFTVRHYEGEDAAFVEVSEGAVQVKNRAQKAERELKAGEALRLAPDGTMSPLDGVARDVALAWTRDSIVFDNAPLKTVVPELVRWFSMDAALGDEALGDRPVSMRVALSSSGDATKALTDAASLAIQFGKNDRIEFIDAPVKPDAGKKK